MTTKSIRRDRAQPKCSGGTKLCGNVCIPANKKCRQGLGTSFNKNNESHLVKAAIGAALVGTAGVAAHQAFNHKQQSLNNQVESTKAKIQNKIRSKVKEANLQNAASVHQAIKDRNQAHSSNVKSVLKKAALVSGLGSAALLGAGVAVLHKGQKEYESNKISNGQTWQQTLNVSSKASDAEVKKAHDYNLEVADNFRKYGYFNDAEELEKHSHEAHNLYRVNKAKKAGEFTKSGKHYSALLGIDEHSSDKDVQSAIKHIRSQGKLSKEKNQEINEAFTILNKKKKQLKKDSVREDRAQPKCSGGTKLCGNVCIPANKKCRKGLGVSSGGSVGNHLAKSALGAALVGAAGVAGHQAFNHRQEIKSSIKKQIESARAGIQNKGRSIVKEANSPHVMHLYEEIREKDESPLKKAVLTAGIGSAASVGAVLLRQQQKEHESNKISNGRTWQQTLRVSSKASDEEVKKAHQHHLKIVDNLRKNGYPDHARELEKNSHEAYNLYHAKKSGVINKFTTNKKQESRAKLEAALKSHESSRNNYLKAMKEAREARINYAFTNGAAKTSAKEKYNKTLENLDEVYTSYRKNARRLGRDPEKDVEDGKTPHQRLKDFHDKEPDLPNIKSQNESIDKTSSGKNWHQVLGVSPSATNSQIKAAYHALAKSHHPDLNPDITNNQKIKEINEAYEISKKRKKQQTSKQDSLITKENVRNWYDFVEVVV